MKIPWLRQRGRQSGQSVARPTEIGDTTMNTDATDTQFTHVVTGSGAAQGMTITGKRHLLTRPPAPTDVPLIIALPGGTYTSTYFDIPGYSLLDRAAVLGIPIAALDRPGYGGSTPLAPEDSTISKNADVLDQVIGELWEAWGAGTSGVFLIGHSIGGAIVTQIAANHPAWPLLGMAVSGCLLQVPSDSRNQWSALPAIPMIDLPVAMKDQVMFGPDWTYDTGMPQNSHPANAPVPRAELIDITTTWIARVRSEAAKITVPVHSRQAEFDHLWVTDAQQVHDFGAAFTASPRVDAQLVASAGHCIDFHRPGAGFQLSQLGFALQCCVNNAS
jgi:pimeloyl-ACP methyl ester carboxylesterase